MQYRPLSQVQKLVKSLSGVLNTVCFHFPLPLSFILAPGVALSELLCGEEPQEIASHDLLISPKQTLLQSPLTDPVKHFMRVSSLDTQPL